MPEKPSVVQKMHRDEEKLIEVRRKSRILIAWGTCAVFGGLPALANAFELEELIEETYGQTIDPFSYYLKGKIPAVGRYDFGIEEHLLRKVRKLSDVVRIRLLSARLPADGTPDREPAA